MELVFKPPEEVNTGGVEQQSATQHQQCNISDTHTVKDAGKRRSITTNNIQIWAIKKVCVIIPAAMH